jgi:hypothetical protein
MRRVALFWGSVVLAFLGLASAWVLTASGNSTASGQPWICHSGNGKHFTPVPPSDIGALEGHAKNDPDDIIPPFVMEDGTTFPGQNLSTIYGSGYTGAEVLANNCVIPSGGGEITMTGTTEVATTVPVTDTVPPTTVTVPAETSTSISTETITVPGDTTSVPGTTITVTVPADVTTTVSQPERTVTVPPVTITAPGQTIQRPAETVTLPGTSLTVTAPATTTVVTVSGPNRIVHDGLVDKRRITVTVRTPRRLISIARHRRRFLASEKVAEKKRIIIALRCLHLAVTG